MSGINLEEGLYAKGQSRNTFAQSRLIPARRKIIIESQCLLSKALLIWLCSKAWLIDMALMPRDKTCRTGKIKMDNKSLFEQAIRAKAAYRKDAQALSWEEKIASIERMREVSKEARKAMRKARQNNQSRKPR